MTATGASLFDFAISADLVRLEWRLYDVARAAKPRDALRASERT